MNWLQRLWRRRQQEELLEKELRFHLDEHTDDLIGQGMAPEEARRQAQLALGGREQVKEGCRDARGTRWLDDLWQDMRYGARLLRKHKSFTLVAALSLSLGIGANTAIFSLLDALLLKSLPVTKPEELVLFGNGGDDGLTDGFPNRSWDLFSYPFYQEVQRHKEVFSEVGALLSMTWGVHGTVSGANGEMESLNVQLVSGTYFPVLGVRALAGRVIAEADDQTPGAHPVAVASYSLWQRLLGGDPSAIGKSITIDRTSYTIIGIAPPEFFGTTVGRAPDLWIPLAMEKQMPPGYWDGRNNKTAQSLYLIGRLKEGASREQASAVVNLLFHQTLQERAGTAPTPERLQDIQRAKIELTPAGKGLSALRREFSLSLRVLMAVVGFVLLIACANVANLSLARAANRQRELAIRLAVGAGRSRLIRQLLTESVLLAGLGGLIGVALAWWGSQVLLLMASDNAKALPLDVTPNARILAFTLMVSLLSALLFGLIPALRAARLEPNAALNGEKGAVQTWTQSRFGKALVVAQVALSLVLLIGAGLFMRTLVNLENMPTGFTLDNAMLVRVDVTTTGLKDVQLAQLTRELEEKVKAVPGVQSASLAFFVFGGGQWTSPLYTRGRESQVDQRRSVRQNVVGADFFDAMGLPLIAGRGFGPQDTITAPNVAVISESLARQLFPQDSPLGRHFGKSQGTPDEMEIVGIVRDARYGNLMEELRPMAYYPQSQRPAPLDNLVIRYSGAPESIVPQIRQAARQVNQNIAIDEVVSLSDYVGRTLVRQKLIARLGAFFGLLAVLLACIGLHGVLSYSVVRRTHEIGIRRALGAPTRRVLWMIFRDALRLVGLGLCLGLGASLTVTKFAESLLFGLRPNDPLTIVIATTLLFIVVAFAGYLPARRATRVDPLVALRQE